MRKVVLIAVVLLLAIAVVPALAATSSSCDEGKIRGVSVRISGHKFVRPESRFDGQPSTETLGPFPVHAWLIASSGVEAVDLFFSTDGSNFDSAPMTIDGLDVSGVIPRLNDVGFGERTVHFLLIAYDSEGNVIWIDEITDPCDGSEGGDPFNFRVLSTPFDGDWKKIDHQRKDPTLRFRKSWIDRSSTGLEITYTVFYTGYKGNISVEPTRANLQAWFLLETDTRSYTYDQGTGYITETILDGPDVAIYAHR